MARYLDIAEDLRSIIRRGQIKPGEAVESERAMSRRYGVAYSTVRMATDLLAREGLIERRHGRGTFVSTTFGRRKSKRTRRLGLLYAADGEDNRIGPYSRRLTLAIQDAARALGYELLIEQMRMGEVMAGRTPAMLKRRSVDGILLDGWFTQAHTRFLQDQGMPYVAMGIRPLNKSTPQVRPNLYRLAREVTRELIQNGRGPIWLEADPGHNPDYLPQVELTRGYMDELQAAGRNDVRLCPMRWDQMAGAVGRLLESDLKSAAVIVSGWVWPMVAAALMEKHPDAGKVLFVPLAGDSLENITPGCRYVRWRQTMSESLTAGAAVRGLVEALEERGAFRSVRLDPSCRIFRSQGVDVGEMNWRETKDGPEFALNGALEGSGWHVLEGRPAAS